MTKEKLTKANEYAIKGMLAEDMNVGHMAQIIGKRAGLIQDYIDTLIVEVEPEPEVTEVVREEKGRPKAKDMIINKTIGNKSGVAIMTHGASERGDESRTQADGKSRITETAIFKIRK